MEYLGLLIIGYFIGSIQIPIMAGKVLKKIDIRDYGSGNAGSTNVARVLGVKVAVTVFILDILKGVVPYLIVKHFFNAEYAIVIGLGIVIGHNFPIFMNFKGGKGAAISLGIMTAFSPVLGALILVMAVLIVSTTKYVSLASINGALMAVIYVFVTNTTVVEKTTICIMAVLLVYQHRGNIKRLIKGEENKLTLKKK